MDYRTDLAMEIREILMAEAAEEITGISSEDYNFADDISITRVKIEDQDAARRMGKPMGSYVTINAQDIHERDIDYASDVSRAICSELRKLYPPLEKGQCALIVGLGNWNMTPDSLGPKCIDKILVTRHLLEMVPEQVDERVRSVCAIAPGVLGITGIETQEAIKGIVTKVKPNVVIAIDALACRRSERICSTVQISDTGISPGGGIGNKRKGLNEKTLGVPVIAIGVPMVVYASTLTMDVMEKLTSDLRAGSDPMLKQVAETSQDKLFDSTLRAASSTLGDMIVTPKDIDLLVTDSASIVAMGINLALHNNISSEEINQVVH